MELEDILPDPRGINEPRYKDSPIYLFFEDLVLDYIGELTPEQDKANQELNLQSIFNTRAQIWQGVVVEVLDLSDTLYIAAIDLWNRNRDTLIAEGKNYHPLAFAQDFVDHYLEDDSKVDVWTDKTLAAAKARIAKH